MNQALTAFVLMFYDFEGEGAKFGKNCQSKAGSPSAKKTDF